MIFANHQILRGIIDYLCVLSNYSTNNAGNDDSEGRS